MIIFSSPNTEVFTTAVSEVIPADTNTSQLHNQSQRCIHAGNYDKCAAANIHVTE